MSSTIFVRLLADDDKETMLADTIGAVRQGERVSNLYATDPTSFRQIPGSPFSYWAQQGLRNLFTSLPAFESEGRTARRGPSSGDDFRRVRAWWEVEPRGIGRSRKWVPFSKGGSFSPFYADVHLLVAWDESRRTFRGFHGRHGRMIDRPESLDFFFRSGVTWPRSTVKGFNVRAMQRGCIFADKGPSAFIQGDHHEGLLKLVGLMNSKVFEHLLLLQTASRAWEVGLVQQTPVPNLATNLGTMLVQRTLEYIEKKRALDSTNETSHAFHLPLLLQVNGSNLEERMAACQYRTTLAQAELSRLQVGIDDIVFQMYEISSVDRLTIEASLTAEGDGILETDENEAVPEEAPTSSDSGAVAADLAAYALGVGFGRWDVRLVLDRSLVTKLAQPFDSLPDCSPGMLVGPDGLPARSGGIVSEEWQRARPDVISVPPEGSVTEMTIPDADYPLRIDWDGILVDDPDHSDDIVRRVGEVFQLLWRHRSDSIEAEATEILGVKELRHYFRNPKHFFEHHIRRYSKSRRKAPIYWLLQSPKRHYALWLYYHRLDPDILFKALVNYIEPKIRLEEDHRRGLDSQRQATGPGSEMKRLERTIDQQEALLSDLYEFRDRLSRAAHLHLQPDLDDGVLLNIAPLRELVPWKEAKRTWDELLAGKYEWSSISKQLRERGLV